MIALTQITSTEIFAFITVLVFELLSRKVLFTDIFQDTFETSNRSFICTFSIYMTIPLIKLQETLTQVFSSEIL